MQALTLQFDRAIAELFYQVTYSGHLTRTQSHKLLSLCQSALSPDDRDAVNRLLYAIRRGWIRISDEPPQIYSLSQKGENSVDFRF